MHNFTWQKGSFAQVFYHLFCGIFVALEFSCRIKLLDIIHKTPLILLPKVMEQIIYTTCAIEISHQYQLSAFSFTRITFVYHAIVQAFLSIYVFIYFTVKG